MRPGKKINRGVIIAVIAIISVSIYLIGIGIIQNNEKPAIQNVVESYINTYVSYNMLPEKYRIANPNIPQAELDSYISKMESDIKSYFIVNDDSYKFMVNTLKSDLEIQKTETTVVYSYKKTISKYTAFNVSRWG